MKMVGCHGEIAKESFSLSSLLNFLTLVSCGSLDYKKPPAKLTNPEGPLKYDVMKMKFGSVTKADMTVVRKDRWEGTTNRKQRGYQKMTYSFKTKGKTLYIINYNYGRSIDLLKYKKGDTIEGDVGTATTVYEVLKTSKDELITKIVDFKSKRRIYRGKEFDPEKWTGNPWASGWM